MTLCFHESCCQENKVWLPLPTNDHFRTDVKLHPWCKHCGLVKNISEDRAHKLGYWMNILSKIADHFSIKQIHKRLIAKELTSHELFNDTYSITGFSQKELFKKIVKKYCKINLNSIESFFY